jgi:hypothetical protein
MLESRQAYWKDLEHTSLPGISFLGNRLWIPLEFNKNLCGTSNQIYGFNMEIERGNSLKQLYVLYVSSSHLEKEGKPKFPNSIPHCEASFEATGLI